MAAVKTSRQLAFPRAVVWCFQRFKACPILPSSSRAVLVLARVVLSLQACACCQPVSTLLGSIAVVLDGRGCPWSCSMLCTTLTDRKPVGKGSSHMLVCAAACHTAHGGGRSNHLQPPLTSCNHQNSLPGRLKFMYPSTTWLHVPIYSKTASPGDQRHRAAACRLPAVLPPAADVPPSR